MISENIFPKYFLFLYLDMALLRYLKLKREVKQRDDISKDCLPDANGPLAVKMPSSSITVANSSVAKVLEKQQKQAEPRGEYRIYTAKERAEIGNRAAVYGINSTIRYYKKINPQRLLPSSSVFDFKVKYQQELLKRKRNQEENLVVTELPSKKKGRSLLLGELLDGRVQSYIKELRSKGAVVNTAIVMACAEGVVMHHNSNLLAINGGHITINKDWAKSLLHRMGYVKRRVSTSAKVAPQDFDDRKEQFLYDAQVLVNYEEIPDSLVVNWDHTGIKYVPVSSWTMEKEGKRRVEILGIDDKRQITAVFAATKDGNFLPIQVIYKGKTKRSLPNIKFPSDWLASYTENHWANERTTKEYIYKILLPYVNCKREELGLPSSYPALVVYDRFKAQCTSDVLQILRENHIDTLLIPASCTDQLQPLDVSVNKSAKEFLRKKFQLWYSEQVCSQLQDRSGEVKPLKPVDLHLNNVKPLGAKWLMEMYDHFKSNPQIILNGFRKSGLLE